MVVQLIKDGDLIFTFKNSDDSLKIVGQYSNKNYMIETFEFADGTIITADDIFSKSIIHGEGKFGDFTSGSGTRNSTLIGSDSEDTISGNDGDDVLDGGKGDDTLKGGADNDTYIFNLGYGNDTIDETANGSSADKVVFGEGITWSDVEYRW